MRIIPAIDLRAGRCVRLLRGDFRKETIYHDDPVALAMQFARLDVRDLHVVDLDGARTGRPVNTDVVRAIASATTLDVQLGGGIRDAATLEEWLAVGVQRCVVGSKAVTAAAEVADWIGALGGDRIVLALDVTIGADGVPMLATDGWTRTSGTGLWECIDGYLDCGLQHVLCTDIERDGALGGPNLDLYRQFIARYPALKLQASGGVRDATDLRALAEAGVAATITGRALLEGRISESEVASFRRSA